MEHEILLKIATSFYTAIERIPYNSRPREIKDFPHGACGDASLLLGAYLKDKNISGFIYVCGERGDMNNGSWTTHAWLQREAIIIDITAGQFSDSPAKIIVSEKSLWHNQFRITNMEEISDFRKYYGHGIAYLYTIYSLILEELAPAC